MLLLKVNFRSVREGIGKCLQEYFLQFENILTKNIL